MRNYVEDIRDEFRRLKENNIVSKGTYEIQAASFIANEPTIFGKLNEEYINAELEWYKSMSLSVHDIKKYYGKVPMIWEQVCDNEGYINSNYGWCVFSNANGFQYKRVVRELHDAPNSRQATMYYTRPTMHIDAQFNGMSDHMCTYAVSYHVNEDKVDAHVYMRSNDAIFGYNNDLAWQRFVLNSLADDLTHAHNIIKPGDIHWHASSLHIYDRHWHLIT